jgi:murein DD-endopeptidase MepM/ murein hydrolase activator NlpD
MSNGPSGHGANKGIDITTGVKAGIKNYPIYAQGDGDVTDWGDDENNTRGNFVEITYDNGLKVRYLHLRNAPSVNDNQVVTKATLLGYTGNTGLGYLPTSNEGFHLHQDIRIGTSTIYTNTDTFYPSGTFRHPQ